MRLLLHFLNGIRALFRRGIANEELDAELQAFVETAVDEKIRGGMSREEATRRARLELGLVSVDGVKDRVREVGWESKLESVARDVQYAVRTLRNAPGFAAVAVLTLALGIGANVAIFGLIDALMLRQLPVRNPEQLVVRTQVTAAIRGEIQPRLAGKPLRVRTLTGPLESGLVRERLMTTLASIFGVLALSLAVVGVYGVLAFSVARRTGEIGVRIALGARQSQVLGEIFQEAGRMVALGMVIGLPIAWMASTLVSSMLFGVTAHDPVTSVASIVVLACAAFVAAFLPARRAAHVDPLVALRAE